MMMQQRVAMANASQIERLVLADQEAAARRAAEWLLERALAVEGPPAFCLSGGLTPRMLYAMLAQEPFRDRFPWKRAHWFFGDERLVPPDNERSNYRMVRETLFDHVPIPAAHIHRVPTELGNAVAVAAAYEADLKAFYGAPVLAGERSLFAATLLGVGEDGHTASLFPNAPTLEERTRWVVPALGPSNEPRVTLTIPVLESGGEVGFLVTGSDKHEILTHIWLDDDLPAARIQPAGRLRWFVDRAAAGSRET
jgi:6-phosphogluconolactonase